MVKDYLQQFGVDFDQIFAVVIKSIDICIFFAITGFYDLTIDQIDIKMVFLYKDINQLLYVEFPKSYYKDQEHMVCKLNKVLYDLK